MAPYKHDRPKGRRPRNARVMRLELLEPRFLLNGGGFSDISAGLTGIMDGSAAWGDYDNDGDLDLVITGRIGGAN
jgi:hypothetical protein